MKKEIWRIWQPTTEIINDLYFKELKYNHNGLNINLDKKDNISFYTISFDIPLSYRMADEGDLLKTWSEMEDRQYLGKSSLFTIENSLYLKWFREQSCGMHCNTKIMHYSIATRDEVIDILSIQKPNVKLIVT